MPECQSCQGFVTADFIRVFGIDGEVRRCLSCSTAKEVKDEQI